MSYMRCEDGTYIRKVEPTPIRELIKPINYKEDILLLSSAYRDYLFAICSKCHTFQCIGKDEKNKGDNRLMANFTVERHRLYEKAHRVKETFLTRRRFRRHDREELSVIRGESLSPYAFHYKLERGTLSKREGDKTTFEEYKEGLERTRRIKEKEFETKRALYLQRKDKQK